MYIYESHLGGLYATDEAQDWDEMYCETCGDSDWELGVADTLEEAWELLEPKTEGCGVCDTCPLAEAEAETSEDDDPFAELECCKTCTKPNAGYGVWDLLYMMNFLHENFECENPSFVYVIPHQNDSVYVDFQKNKKETFNSLPFSFCIDPERKELIAKALALKVISTLNWYSKDSYSSELKFVAQLKLGNDTIYIYELNVDHYLDTRIGTAGYNGKCYAGFIPKEEVKFYGKDKVVWEYFQKKGTL